MTDKDFGEFRELILDLKAQINNIDRKVNDIDKKVDVGFAKIDKKVDVGFAKVDVDFAEVKGEFKRIDVELKRIEQKLDNKLDGYGKRLEGAEFISRASVTAIFIGLAGGLAKLIFFSN